MFRPGLTLIPLFAIVNHASKTERLTTHTTKDVPTMPHIHLNTIRDGYALVYRDSTILGRIKRITWPHTTDGHIWNETHWEARASDHTTEANPHGFPSFATRAEAVAYLTNTT